MHPDDALRRVRAVTTGLTGMSLLGVAAVAGLAHASSVAQRSASTDQHLAPRPSTTVTTQSPAAVSPSVPARPTHVPKPRHTKVKKAPPVATSGGS